MVVSIPLSASQCSKIYLVRHAQHEPIVSIEFDENFWAELGTVDNGGGDRYKSKHVPLSVDSFIKF